MRLGKANPPCFGAPPGISQAPSRELPPPPPPPPSRYSSNSAANPVSYPMPWTPLNTRPKYSGWGPPDGSGGGSGAGDPTNPSGNPHPRGAGGAGANSSGRGVPPRGGPPNGNPGSGSALPPPAANSRSRSTWRQSNPGVYTSNSTSRTSCSGSMGIVGQVQETITKTIATFELQDLQHILDVQQMLEVWYDRSTFAIATWRGDAQPLTSFWTIFCLK